MGVGCMDVCIMGWCFILPFFCFFAFALQFFFCFGFSFFVFFVFFVFLFLFFICYALDPFLYFCFSIIYNHAIYIYNYISMLFYLTLSHTTLECCSCKNYVHYSGLGGERVCYCWLIVTLLLLLLLFLLFLFHLLVYHRSSFLLLVYNKDVLCVRGVWN